MNLIGFEFGRLRPVKHLGTVSRHSYYLCECVCGNLTSVRRDHLFDRSVLSCGCYGKEKRQRRPDAAIRWAYAEKKSNAKQKGIRFELTFSEFRELMHHNCHYCDAEPVLRGREGYKFIGQESLDRKNPYGHYTIDNVVPCCLSCNVRKGAKSYEEFKMQIYIESPDYLDFILAA